MKANPVFSLNIPTKLFFGCGEIERLSTEKLPGKKALIVISAGTSMKKYGYLSKVQAQLKLNNVDNVVFDKVLQNPIKSHVMEAAALCRQEGCDFVVGLGGGSSIDSAKAIAIMACNDGDLWDYVSGGSGKGRPYTKVLPIVAIPTTAGTGTEIDPWSVITNEEAQEKIGLGTSPYTFPTLSIVDPELMLSIPPALTAYQGFDAFFHSLASRSGKFAIKSSLIVHILFVFYTFVLIKSGNLTSIENLRIDLSVKPFRTILQISHILQQIKHYLYERHKKTPFHSLDKRQLHYREHGAQSDDP